MDLPRFSGQLRAWDQGIWSEHFSAGHASEVAAGAIEGDDDAEFHGIVWGGQDNRKRSNRSLCSQPSGAAAERCDCHNATADQLIRQTR